MTVASTIFIVFALIMISFLIYHVLQMKLKKVVLFTLLMTPKSFEINEVGTYAISIIGLTNEFKIDGLRPEVVFETTRKVPLKKILFSRMNWKGQPGVQKWKFQAPKKGIYKLNFINLTAFINEHPRLTSSKPFSDKTIITKDLTVLISR